MTNATGTRFPSSNSIAIVAFVTVSLAIEFISQNYLYIPHIDIFVALGVAFAATRFSRMAGLVAGAWAALFLAVIHTWQPIEMTSLEKLSFWLVVLGLLLIDVELAKREVSRREKESSDKTRLELEEKISDRNQELVILTESIPQIVWRTDKSGKLSYVNQRWIEFTGQTVEESTWENAFHPEDAQRASDAWAHAVSTKSAYKFEFRLRAKDGSYRWHLSHGLPMLDANGSVDKFIGTLTDIHEQKRIAETLAESHRALQKSEKQLRLLSESLPQIVWTADVHGDLDYYNGRWFDYTGLTLEQSIGFGWELALHPEDIEKCAKDWRAAVASGMDFECQIRIKRLRDHSYRWHLGRAMPVRNEEGQVLKWFGSCTDVHDESEALTREKAAIAASEMKSTFLANMSHEIRTPINGVLGMLNLIIDTSLTDEQKNYAETARSSADTLLSLINDILDLTKAESGKIDLEEIDFDMEHVFLDIERTLSYVAKKKGLKLLKSISPDLPASFRGDPTRLRQILINLVNNAIKFTPAGHVAIECEFLDRVETSTKNGPEAFFVKFEISDTGVGIPNEALDRMFKAFSQADSSTTRRFGGTGLGLSISKHLVEIMGGKIGVRSEPGRGSTFWFTVPLKGALASSPVLENSLASALAKTPREPLNLRILLAEDNSVNQLIAVKMLQKMGHSVVVAANGLEAIDALRDSDFDLILMDCQMPELDGYSATKIIRTSNSLTCGAIPIIAMTANAMTGDREKCLHAGMNDYVAKPVRANDLEDVILRTYGQSVDRATPA